LNELLRYGAVGVVNTCFGYAVFWAGMRLCGLAPGTANAVSYASSLCLTFLLSRYFVFNSAPPAKHAAWRFVLAFCIAFAINQAVLWGLLQGGSLSPAIAQLFSMVAYTVVFFLLSRFFVFRDTRARRGSQAS
jgi:putative flippase GtrA